MLPLLGKAARDEDHEVDMAARGERATARSRGATLRSPRRRRVCRDRRTVYDSARGADDAAIPKKEERILERYGRRSGRRRRGRAAASSRAVVHVRRSWRRRFPWRRGDRRVAPRLLAVALSPRAAHIDPKGLSRLASARSRRTPPAPNFCIRRCCEAQQEARSSPWHKSSKVKW